jgi:hypothetical protein
MTEAWIDATYEALFYDGRTPRTDQACQVLLQNGHIQVRYVDDGGNTVTYTGTERGPGHFELRARTADGDGQATLHRFQASPVLEGYWCEGTVRGMWRIRTASTRGVPPKPASLPVKG